jgi:hypothetical protein
MRMFAIALAAMTFPSAAAAQQPRRTCSERAGVCAQRCSELPAGRGGRSREYDRFHDAAAELPVHPTIGPADSRSFARLYRSRGPTHHQYRRLGLNVTGWPKRL